MVVRVVAATSTDSIPPRARGRLRAVPLRRPITALWQGGPRDLHGLARELVEVASG